MKIQPLRSPSFERTHAASRKQVSIYEGHRMSHHLLLHLAGPDESSFPDLETAARIARNARAELPDYTIEIVVQGAKVKSLLNDGDSAPILNSLVEAGFTISACANSLRSIGIERKQLVEGALIVSAAVAHLAKKQIEGAAYIRL